MKKLLTNKFVIAGLVLVILLAAYYFYDKRWHKFTNNGDTTWLPTTNKGKLAFMMQSKPSGLSVGDAIEVEIDKTGTTSQTTIIEILEPDNYYNSYWVVTSNAYYDYGGGIITGRLRKA